MIKLTCQALATYKNTNGRSVEQVSTPRSVLKDRLFAAETLLFSLTYIQRLLSVSLSAIKMFWVVLLSHTVQSACFWAAAVSDPQPGWIPRERCKNVRSSIHPDVDWFACCRRNGKCRAERGDDMTDDSLPTWKEDVANLAYSVPTSDDPPPHTYCVAQGQRSGCTWLLRSYDPQTKTYALDGAKAYWLYDGQCLQTTNAEGNDYRACCETNYHGTTEEQRSHCTVQTVHGGADLDKIPFRQIPKHPLDLEGFKLFGVYCADYSPDDSALGTEQELVEGSGNVWMTNS